MADTKITRLRNLLTPFRNYFALLEEQEKEPSLIMQDKMQAKLDTEKERIFKIQAEVWDIIAEIPNEACEGKNADTGESNCTLCGVSQQRERLLVYDTWIKEVGHKYKTLSPNQIIGIFLKSQ